MKDCETFTKELVARLQETDTSSYGCEVSVLVEKGTTCYGDTDMLVVDYGGFEPLRLCVLPLYELYCSGTSFEELVFYIVNAVTSLEVEDCYYPSLSNAEHIRETVVFRLVNPSSCASELYMPSLEDVFHTKFLDLVVVYGVSVINLFNTKEHFVFLTNDMIKSLGLTVEELHECAIRNVAKYYPLSSELISIKGEERVSLDSYVVPDGINGMIRIFNEYSGFGARAILYDGVLNSLSRAFDGDVILFPSSVHEFLAIKSHYDDDLESFSSIVADMNGRIHPFDVLSYSVYHYDAKKRKLSIACSSSAVSKGGAVHE